MTEYSKQNAADEPIAESDVSKRREDVVMAVTVNEAHVKARRILADKKGLIWCDWLNIIVLFVVFEIFLIPSNGSFLFRLLLRFGVGALLTGLYYLTLRMLWIRLFFGIYRKHLQLMCSQCQATILEDHIQCPKCGAEF